MFVKGTSSANIENGKIVLTIKDPITFLLKQGFELSKKIIEETLEESQKLVGKQESIELYKDKLTKLDTKEANYLLKMLSLIKPQTKIGDFYYNDFDITIFEPDMKISEIIVVHGLDTLVNQVKKEVDDPILQKKIQKLEGKKEKIVQGGATFGSKPHKIVKYNKYNKSLVNLYK